MVWAATAAWYLAVFAVILRLIAIIAISTADFADFILYLCNKFWLGFSSVGRLQLLWCSTPMVLEHRLLAVGLSKFILYLSNGFWRGYSLAWWILERFLDIVRAIPFDDL